jgi:DivIVA domain-containing protein
MDVTPQVINEVEFHQKMRGYDPDEVDDFLERVASAVGQLTERLHEAEARAAAADRRAFEFERKVREVDERPAARENDDTETITRTLVLAQKTADAAVKEANDEAQRTLADARQKYDAMVTEAEERSQRLVSDAEIEARKTSEETRQRMADEIVALEASREALKADHGVIERHLDEQRLRLRGAITDLQRLLDDPEKLRAAALPELSVVAKPSFSVADSIEPESVDDEVIDLSEADEDVEDNTGSDDDELVERPVSGGVRFSPPDDSNGTGAQPHGAQGPVVTHNDEGDTDAWSRFVREEMIDQPTAAVSMPAGEDAYLVELRKAMLDDSVSADSGAIDRPARSRFGRRR